MKKQSFFSHIIVGVLIITMLTACSSTGPSIDGDKKSGKITLAMPLGEQWATVYNAVAEEYMRINPGVSVVIEDKDASSYFDWLGNQFASGEVTADIVQNNQAEQYYSENKFVDFNRYMNKPNSYADGELWGDVISESAYRNNFDQSCFTLNVDSVQIMWFYNKEIFEQANVEPPQTWDELAAVCEKISALGITPLALAGDIDAFWNTHFAWLLRMYGDQYWRDCEPLTISREGDYNYDPDLNAQWELDMSDIENDAPTNVVFNKVLNLQNIQNGIYGPDSDKYREMYENLNKIIPKYVPSDYFALGYRECSDRFLSGECAIYLDATWYIPIFADEQEKNPELFDMGWFWSPPMEGENVGSTTVRSLGGPNGFIGVVNKSQAQNDLSMDFLMFYASPQGQTIRFQAMLENNVQPQGLPLVKNVTLPEKWAPMFEGIENHGECDLDPVANFLTGVDGVKRSIRDSADLMQQFFRNEITVDELSKKQYQVVIDNIPDAVKLHKWREDALLDPSKDPFSN